MILKIPLPYRNMLWRFFCIIFLLTFTGCKNDEAQISFVNQAYGIPTNFTKTDVDGSVVNEDSDDWRISPAYEGLVEVRPIYQNPIQFGNQVILEVYFKGTVYNPRIELGYLSESNEWYVLQVREITSDFDFIDFTFYSNQFGTTAEQARGLHRLLLFDGNQRLITYGDLLIQ